MPILQQSKTGAKMRVEPQKSKRGFVKYEKNPLVKPKELVMKERTIKVGSARELVDTATGEVSNVNAIYQRKVIDSEKFAKVYLDGVSRTFDLKSAARKVFSVILQVCGKDTDSIYLNFMVAEQHGSDLSKATFMRGMRELIEKGFIAESVFPHQFWINVHLFFNGDRVKFITEYVKEDVNCKTSKPADVAERDALERLGQQRLVD